MVLGKRMKRKGGKIRERGKEKRSEKLNGLVGLVMKMHMAIG